MAQCLCGCGAVVSPGRKWRRGHNATLPKEMTPARAAAIRKCIELNTIPLAERIAKFSARPNERGCVEWTGTVDKRGYGRLGVNGRNRAVTHLVLELDGRPRPSDDHVACHSCDNPPCINPAHLWWGTQSDNMKDCFKKSRSHIAGLALGWKYGRGGVPA